MKLRLVLVVVGLLACAPSLAVCQTAAADRDSEIQTLHRELDAIAARLKALETTAGPVAPNVVTAAPAAVTAAVPVAVSATPAAESTVAADDRATLKFLHDTTLNFGLDGYYGYNFNRPIGGANQLRAYDLRANSFSINQASVVVERLPQAAAGERFGGRLDLQFGQATETLQGSAANELQPAVWRNLFQAYGSYLAPVGSGLQVDFGKWASALGPEGNYTKDQMNYSRSYLFNYLPFYHTGFRANYNLTPKVNVAYWLVNGAQQTDDFNGFKSQAFIFTLKPVKSVTWNVNYYLGQEQAASASTGIAPNGREHIFDTYATWNATSKLTLLGEADYVINRVDSHSAPAHVTAGAAYARYALAHKNAVAARVEYLSDRGGLFSGTTQALKEGTFTFEHQFEPGFVARAEYRRDFSNQRYFTTDRQGVLSGNQQTAMLGLVYWWGTKQGNW